MIPNQPSLPKLAKLINQFFDEAARHEGALKSARLHAGQHLIMARQQVAQMAVPEKARWEEWCKLHIKRSQGDIRKCMALARSANPAAAEAEERRKAREGMQKHRANVSAVALEPPQPEPEVWRRQADRILGDQPARSREELDAFNRPPSAGELAASGIHLTNGPLSISATGSRLHPDSPMGEAEIEPMVIAANQPPPWLVAQPGGEPKPAYVEIANNFIQDSKTPCAEIESAKVVIESLRNAENFAISAAATILANRSTDFVRDVALELLSMRRAGDPRLPSGEMLRAMILIADDVANAYADLRGELIKIEAGAKPGNVVPAP